MNEQQPEIDRLLMQGYQAAIQQKLGQELWTTVYRASQTDNESIHFYCALIPDPLVDEVLAKVSWDLSIGSGMPSYTIDPAEPEQPVYFRFGSDKGIEPLVYCRHFHSLKPDYIEISEEFRHFHNLYHEPKKDIYFFLDEAGNEEEAIQTTHDLVRIKTRLLKQFLAVKGMHLAIYFQINVRSLFSLQELGIQEIEQPVRVEKIRYDLFVRDAHFDLLPYKSFSGLLGKKLIPGAAMYPGGFSDQDKDQYQDFIIGTDPDGNEITCSCNPAELDQPSSKQSFLTPVFFRNEVLTKYYENSTKYSVEDGYLRCGGLWAIPIDNNHRQFVIAWLGDLGALPYSEQQYWRAFNIPPDGTVSNTHLRRQIYGEFTDPEKADLLFKTKFDAFQELWEKRMGWPLFLPLADADQHLYPTLHIPLNLNQSEFDAQVLALSKILVDYLNEKQLAQIAPPPDANTRGISKLEHFLKSKGLADYQPHIVFLHELWKLRSSGVGHQKGDKYQKAAAAFGIPEQDLTSAFAEILNRAQMLLDYLDNKFLT